MFCSTKQSWENSKYHEVDGLNTVDYKVEATRVERLFKKISVSLKGPRTKEVSEAYFKRHNQKLKLRYQGLQKSKVAQ